MNEEANEQQRQKIVELIREGKVKFAHPINIDKINPDFTITDVQIRSSWDKWESTDEAGKTHGNFGGFIISWQTKSAGFGEISVVTDFDGKIRCDSENMGKKFIQSVFDKLVEKMEIRK